MIEPLTPQPNCDRICTCCKDVIGWPATEAAQDMWYCADCWHSLEMELMADELEFELDEPLHERYAWYEDARAAVDKMKRGEPVEARPFQSTNWPFGE